MTESNPLAKTKILLVDDNDDIRDVFGIGLEMLGYQYIGVANGTDALEQFPLFKPDIMIVDQGLPDIQGTEIGRQVRAMASGQNISIALLTGTDSQDLRDQATQSGFDQFFVKPVRIKVIAEWIQAQLLR